MGSPVAPRAMEAFPMDTAVCRPFKKARLSPPTLNKTYFHVLNEESAENIVRLVSDRPRHIDWLLYTRTEDTLMLLKTVGPISFAARRLLCVIRGGYSKLARRPRTEDFRLKEIEMLRHLHCEAGNVFVKVYLPSCFPRRFFGPVFPNLKALYIDSDRPFTNFPVLEYCELESLYLQGTVLPDAQIREIADNCGHLRSLSIQYRRVEGSLGLIFLRNKPTLKYLSLNCGEHRYGALWLSRAIGKLAQYGSGLRKLKLKGFEDDEDVIKDILAICSQNKTTLELMVLNGPFQQEYTGELARLCPTMSLSLPRCEEDYGAQLLAMGTTASRIALQSTSAVDEMFHSRSVHDLCTSCPNISSLSLVVRPRQRHILSSFFTASLPRLASISVDLRGIDQCLTPSYVFLMLARCSTLTSVNFHGDLPGMCALRKFVVANKNLQDVTITNSGERSGCCLCDITPPVLLGDGAYFSWGPILRELHAAKGLQQVVLRCNPETQENAVKDSHAIESVADALLAYKGRRPFSAVVCGHRYE